MNKSTSPVPGVFHFLQHSNVSSHDWQRIGQAITTAYQQLCQRPDTLGLATAPVICEYTGKKPYQLDDSLMGLDLIGFNGERASQLAGDPFMLYRRQTPHALIRCDTRGYPYHWLVMAALLLANTQCPNTWTIESDVPLKQRRKVAHWLSYHCKLPVSPLC
ncbi:hypothetical protein KGP17_23150 [Serratia sp. JSRIV001]|uniref:hypothetical protein n=1 Tax=unclassified Serratia (in: enterobacteria) TaxID=2647522 RepID=UPI001CBE542C|nr:MULTISPECIES: hypothetical protein [unclassified Serratia (in: enterobacteria)]UAN45247.1 hypothetical protein KGP17_23150 [Serratia sp. JSRIV001]UAN50721.1 hypothetical protein KGP26_23980 [Serratia sp. JSRIV002]UAN56687.1 hypothetical protein KGP21_24210 [Serratia sp. JSRIV004]